MFRFNLVIMTVAHFRSVSQYKRSPLLDPDVTLASAVVNALKAHFSILQVHIFDIHLSVQNGRGVPFISELLHQFQVTHCSAKFEDNQISADEYGG